MPDHDGGFSDEFFFGLDGGENDPTRDPWSIEGRRQVLAPVTAFFERMSAAELAHWSFLHVVVGKYWYPPDHFPDNMVRKALFAVSGQFDKLALAGIPAFIFLDIVFRPRPGQEADRTLGLSLHFHIILRIPPDDTKTKDLVRKSLQRLAPGPRAILFQTPTEKDGGILGSLDRTYFLKDWRNPLKSITGKSIKQPCNDAKNGLMRNFIAKTGLQPHDLLLLKGLKRFGSTIKLAPKRRRS